MRDKSKLTAIILVIITLLVVIGTFIYNKINPKKVESDINIVTNYSNFYTVNSCLYRFITYLSTNDTDSLMLMLNEDYKNKNSVNKDNVLNKFTDVDENSTFSSRKMYYEKINNNVTKYYVYGYIEKNELSQDDIISNSEYKDAYFIVYLDTENKIFSVEPYSGDIFINGDNNE